MLSKTLPRMIYWIILFISSVGLATFNFVRAERQEAGQWQPTLLVLMISLVFFVILDLDRPTAGLIRISQDAMLNLRESGLRDWR